MILGEKLNCRLMGGESPAGEFCCCRTFVFTLGDVASLGDIEITLDGEDGELLVPPLSCLKLLMALLWQELRNLPADGSLFSLFSDEGGDANGFPLGTVEVVGV